VITALWLLALQGAFGAFDTLYYHEWRARLPAGGAQTRPELLLHAVRDMVYAILFALLPRYRGQGAWAIVLTLLVAVEIVITLVDFRVEDTVRAPLGGTFPGERTTHTIMAIIYGAFLGTWVPGLVLDWSAPTGWSAVEAPVVLVAVMTVMSIGVFASGLRDFYAAYGGKGGGWPWTRA
jgi:phosphatidylglycerophosphate synthase